ncbi:hypothetical protein QBC43DRAFT_285655 [Cladorrhinum sp. PSN259]|nr:hypothetical protein QBC43DRAFT_285655 [Cladorrhinum sp. PSN259]
MASSGKRAADLEAYRSEIQDLYWTQDLPLAEVMIKMEQDHKVRATKKMYKKLISAWGLKKNINRDEMIAMLRVEERRRQENKETCFFLRGKAVDPAKLRRFATRYRLTPSQVRSMPLDEEDISPHITYSTPEPESPRLQVASELEGSLLSPVISETETTCLESLQGSPNTQEFEAMPFSSDGNYWGAASPVGRDVDESYQGFDLTSARPLSANFPLFSPYSETDMSTAQDASHDVSSSFPPGPWTASVDQSSFGLGSHHYYATHADSFGSMAEYRASRMGRVHYEEGQDGEANDQLFPNRYSSEYNVDATRSSGTAIAPVHNLESGASRAVFGRAESFDTNRVTFDDESPSSNIDPAGASPGQGLNPSCLARGYHSCGCHLLTPRSPARGQRIGRRGSQPVRRRLEPFRPGQALVQG